MQYEFEYVIRTKNMSVNIYIYIYTYNLPLMWQMQNNSHIIVFPLADLGSWISLELFVIDFTVMFDQTKSQ